MTEQSTAGPACLLCGCPFPQSHYSGCQALRQMSPQSPQYVWLQTPCCECAAKDAKIAELEKENKEITEELDRYVDRGEALLAEAHKKAQEQAQEIERMKAEEDR